MKQEEFLAYLAELRSLPPEVQLEPELKPQRVKLDKKIREEQALAQGAVLSAVLEEGDGGPSPKEGDLVYIQYSIRDLEDDLLYSTRSEEGGSGQAYAFLLERGVRVPRGWEIAIQGMSKGARSVLQVKPGYGFAHPDCAMQPPVRDLPTDQPLRYDISLLNWYPAEGVHQYGAGEALIKRALREGTAWESPRPPFEVTLHLTASCPAYDGLQLTGQRLFSSRGEGRQPLNLQLGRGLLPPGVEEALSFMSKGELAAFVVPARTMRPAAAAATAAAGQRAGGGGGGGGGDDDSSGEDGDLLSPAARGSGGGEERGMEGREAAASRCLVPPPPPRCVQVELEVELISMVQVRDMTGTGEVTKKRLREGTGDFPIDCPLNDTTVRLHFKARPFTATATGGAATTTTEAVASVAAAAAAAGAGAGEVDGGGPWVYDSRGEAGEAAEPLVADTGCGELPEGLEMALKLMVPGEVSRVVAAPRFAYAGREDCPAGVGDAASTTVEFEVELVDFEREGHWQNLSFEARYTLAERLKSKGNDLFKRGQHKFARARYERLLRLLDSTRDFETEEEVAKIDGYKVATLGNLALCLSQLTEYAAAVAVCDKALEFEPENAKMWFRKGKALSLKGDYEEAAEVLKQALEYDPGSEKDINAEIAANAARHQAAVRKQKKDFGSFLKKR
ncbi:hypothetical protein CHLRE_01g017200v5 [Chlamydomonas reinhardtii]|uniref:peptidylprolyl isomerase n=1 Tax=Chlamydomonas reinhardtii TaxID=3055 RepID=A0A2K3E5T5_CHLRE|nr:uncharacterized protein CHLRE_01g017200v5 [Chlamydomonas reinhardtii]PNW88165.1 hypothetical protein CHLRE_01g017200v5 [Chlamydomonas reinhardtii]